MISRTDVAIVAGALLAVNAWLVWFVGAERWLYHADEVAYWSASLGLSGTLADDPWAALVNLSASVAHRTLNLLPAFPVAVALLPFGESRLAYVLCVANVYGLAVLVALLLAARRLGDARAPSFEASAAILATILLASPLWQPVALGYLDLGGVAIALVVLALYLSRPPEELRGLPLVLIGVLAALLFLFRRWYGFWSVAFCALVAAEAVLRALRGGRWTALRPALGIGLAAGGTIALLALPVTMDVLATDFGDRFAAFKEDVGIVAELAAHRDRFGAVVWLAALAAAGFLALDRRRRRAASFLCLQMVVVFLLFRRIQDPDLHHFYLYAPGILCLLAVGIGEGLARLPSRRSRLVAAAILVLLASLVTAGAVSPPVSRALRPWTPVAVAPRARGDLAEIQRLLATLDERIREAPGYVYVFPSGGVISDQTLAFANLSTGAQHQSPALVLPSSHLDRRDGFPCALPRARYAVVPWPVRPEGRREETQVVLVPAESLATGRDVGRAFRRLPAAFRLDRGQEVFVYERTRDFEPAEIAALRERLREKHPDRPEVYEPCP